MRSYRSVLLASFLLPALLGAQTTIKPADLRTRLFTIAADSMGGRDTGSRGNYLTAEYVAAQFRKFGLTPAGENGTFFQTIPFLHIHPDVSARLRVGDRTFAIGDEVLPIGAAIDWKADGVTAVNGGLITDSTTWISADSASGKFVLLNVPADANGRMAFAFLRTAATSARFTRAAAVALVMLDAIPFDLRAQRLQGAFTTTPPPAAQRPLFFISRSTAAALANNTLSGGVRIVQEPLSFAARNVIAILPGSDPALRATYVSLSAHNDHVGYAYAPADHDSVYAYNRVIRGLGADSPDRAPTTEEWTRINFVRDSLRKVRPSRMDSIFNGADDDGTGTVALIEVARALARGKHPARSILFVNHAAEERGLLGSRWFTEHATVPRDSIIGEMDMDMIGRGNTVDLPDGSPAYLEVVGASRLSQEYGALLDSVNARQRLPFKFNLTYDQPGHPLQYYCRADHYSYARYGIPAFAVSRGEHADYHQVTDEPQYIDYNALSRVANLALDFVRTVANLDHRPVLDKPKQDPNAPCRQ